MRSLAGAIQAVGSAELLESANYEGEAGLALVQSSVERIATLPAASSVTTARDVLGDDRSRGRFTADSADSDAVPKDSASYLIAKRTIDIVGSLVGLILLSPLIVIVAIVNKLSDGGPVFYPHTRVGKWGREFRCLKFRTMIVGAEHIKAKIQHLNRHKDHRTFKVPDDPRITGIGKFLRRTSIDEIPQLWNVLCGQMSLVGPRPPVPLEVERYNLDDMQRLMVKPGLTCIWQVSGRSRLPFKEQLALDLAYIQQRSLWLDIKLMLRTIPAVLSADGAY